MYTYVYVHDFFCFQKPYGSQQPNQQQQHAQQAAYYDNGYGFGVTMGSSNAQVKA
jgi:hypothetical protein